MTEEEKEIRAIVLVDHGSKRDAANKLLNDVCCTINRLLGAPPCTHCPNKDGTDFEDNSQEVCVDGLTPGEFSFCEVAHMELAPPDIPAAVSACVERGAHRIVVLPYFLAPGRHSLEDIPRMAAEAGATHEGISVAVAAPLGFDRRLVALALERAAQAAPK